MSFFLKKVGGALIRVGALNRDYTVVQLDPLWETIYQTKPNQ